MKLPAKEVQREPVGDPDMLMKGGMRILIRILPATWPAALALAGCSVGMVSHPAELQRTWESAQVWFPGRALGLPAGDLNGTLRHMQSSITAAAQGLRVPTILYVHGCAGISSDLDWWRGGWAWTLTNAGFAVIAPDSFAREYRPSTCDPATYTGTVNPEVYEMRQAEIEYAVTQMQTLPWVDQRNIFLLGVSEGGTAAALYDKKHFRGHIITAWTCTDSYRSWRDGLWVPKDVPVLALLFENDPWFRPYPTVHGDCGAKGGRRGNVRSIVLEGDGHSTASHSEVRAAILRFLEENRSR